MIAWCYPKLSFFSSIRIRALQNASILHHAACDIGTSEQAQATQTRTPSDLVNASSPARSTRELKLQWLPWIIHDRGRDGNELCLMMAGIIGRRRSVGYIERAKIWETDQRIKPHPFMYEVPFQNQHYFSVAQTTLYITLLSLRMSFVMLLKGLKEGLHYV